MKQPKMQLYNYKCWNWVDTATSYRRAAVFAINEEIALIEIKTWLKRDKYVLFEVFDQGVHNLVKLREFV